MSEALSSLAKKPYYKLLLSLSSGLLLSVSWYWPFTLLVFIALVPLLALEAHIAASSTKRPYLTFAGYGFLALSLWNIGAIWWLWNASGWMTIAAWLANAALQILPLIGYQYISRSAGNRFGVICWLGTWISFEYLHLHWSLSWPWLHLGNAFANTPSWVQWYEYTGSFGGSAWVLWGNWLAYYAIFKNEFRVRLALIIIAPIIYSFIIGSQYKEKGEEVEVVVVQPNLDCYTEKFSYNAKTGERGQASHIPYQQQLERLIKLSEDQITPNTHWVLWPETALHQGVEEGNVWAYNDILQVRAFAKKHPQVAILTGLDTHVLYKNKSEHTPTTRFHNGYGYYDKFGAAALIDSSDQVNFYHKSKLVIGVETIPFRSVLKPIMMNFGGTAGGLGTQPEREVFSYAQSKTAPVICYESIYGDYMTEYVQKGAQFVSIITNDGWWGNTSGHRQHLAYASLRAIETRRDIARSANTGISAFINQKGAIVSATKYDEEIALRGTVKLNDELTLYVRLGDYIARLMAFITAFMFVSVAVKRKMKK